MKRFASPGMLAALVAANIALVFALVATTSSREAKAFGAGASYSLAVGQVNGLAQEGVYLVESGGQTAVVTINAANNKIEIYGTRDISKDLNAKGGR